MSSRSAWTEPGCFAVAPGVFRIPLPLPNDGLRAVNVYAVAYADGLVLIDSGWALQESQDQLASALASIDCGLPDVRRFLVTHIHRDHYTQAVAIRRLHGTPVSLGRGERETLEIVSTPGRRQFDTSRRQLGALGAAALVARLAPFAEPSASGVGDFWEQPDDWLADGQQVPVGERTLHVVETPGHTAGHVVFVDPAADLLFAGDHVLPQITPSISLEAVIPANPLGDFLASLALLRSMPDRLLLPAHGPVAPSVHDRVDELVAHHGRRLEQTEQAVAAGASTAFEVAGQLRWTRREHRLGDLDMFNTVLAVGETGAHLSLLVAQGRLTVTDVDGVHQYAVA